MLKLKSMTGREQETACESLQLLTRIGKNRDDGGKVERKEGKLGVHTVQECYTESEKS